jgi:hypothetical protein
MAAKVLVDEKSWIQTHPLRRPFLMDPHLDQKYETKRDTVEAS